MSNALFAGSTNFMGSQPQSQHCGNIAMMRFEQASSRDTASIFPLAFLPTPVSASGRLQHCKVRLPLLQLADAWSVYQCPSSGFKGSAYPGRSKSCFVSTNRGTTYRAVIASKKGGQSHKTTELDNETSLETEEDLQNKPLGFGEGKVYDTSLEDKLFEEIEEEKAAKVAALRKQKTTSTNSFKTSTSKLPEIVDGVKVWVGDLPKKKNINRDLRSAFKHTLGLLDISPAVQGNEKTRDPICKGFGFLTFDTVDNAKSFVSSFQGQPISFGKVEKKLLFRLVKANEAQVVQTEKKSSTEVEKLRIRDKDAEKVEGSDLRSQLAPFKTVGENVSAEAVQERAHTEKYHPHVEVLEDGESLLGESSSEKEEDDSGDEVDLDDDPEFEVSVDIGDFSGHNASISGAKGAENSDKRDAEKRIEELERRLIKKLEDAGHGAQKDKREKNTVKAKSFNSKRVRASKQSSSKGSNVAALTHRLKKTERAFMTGVFEKYGKAPSSSKS